MFTPTQWSTVVEKEKWFCAFKSFIEHGYPRKQFTKPLYNRLSIMFGHNAHCDRDGFYQTWFSTARYQHKFIQHTLRHHYIDDPVHTWSDVEEAVIAWLNNKSVIVSVYAAAARVEHRQNDLSVVESILSQHDGEFHKLVGKMLVVST